MRGSKNYTTAVFVVFATVLSVFTVHVNGMGTVVPKADFFVATNGNDAWSGTLAVPNKAGTDGPFASPGHARDAVRRFKAAGTNAPITILIRGGTYFLNEPLAFTSADSGSETAPIIYAAYPEEKPVFSAGRAITGWYPLTNGLWAVDVPEVRAGSWYFNQLFINGERRTRARTPNEGYLRTTGPLSKKYNKEDRYSLETCIGFRYADQDLKDWDNLDDAQIVLFHSWTTSHHWIKNLDTSNQTVRFTAPSRWTPSYWETRQRYIVENYREALDVPGEWYLNRKTGQLLYFPLPGEDMTKAVSIAPRHKEVLHLEGDPDAGKWIEYLVFRSLSFQHSEWDLSKDNSADGQNHSDMKSQAVFARGLRRSVFEGCEIAHVGAYAMWLERGCTSNRIQRCHIYDLGAGGLRIGEVKLPENDAWQTGNTIIDNNWIHDSSHIFHAGIGIWMTHSSYNRITHNEISDLDYSGISVGWQWQFNPTTAHDNIIEYNHIHHLGRAVLSDMSGVYTLGVSPGTRIANNVIHDIYSYSYGGWGLYNDEGSEYTVLESNIVYNTKSEGYISHWARNNTLRNNIFALTGDESIRCAPKNEEFYFTFKQNIVYHSGKEMLFGDWTNDKAYNMDSNLYWSTGAAEPNFNGGAFTNWHARGHDRHSVIADPGFVNPAEFDFRLKENSPALKLGFNPVDAGRKAGLYGDDRWVQAPKQIIRVPFKIPSGEGFALSAGEGFENTAVGRPPDLDSLRSGKSGALTVTDQTAATGKNSLKFSDTPDLSPAWSPHLFYKGAFWNGSVRLSFDLRLDPGAAFSIETRDHGKFYRTGPSLTVSSNGDLLAGQRTLLTLPSDKWIHFQIDYVLGPDSTGKFDLTVMPPEGPPRIFQGIDTAGRPKALQWLGFMSPGTNRTCFYLDNVKLDERSVK
ncbi:MAG: hypothetical protein HOO88_05945 [Kiritimatiellaceae bacterium]|nr:hypothetical protein [Kiritimatiellaceae bacterium]